eukprot:9031047-Pyramimonas_sp.AAC.1
MRRVVRRMATTMRSAAMPRRRGLSFALRAMQNNPLQFPMLTDFWCAWDLTDRRRLPALLVDDMQIEYESYVFGRPLTGGHLNGG